MLSTSLRRGSIVAASAAALALALAGCSPDSGASGPDTTPTAGGTLVYASGDAEPTCLDPHVGGNYPQALVGTQYVEELVSLDKQRRVIPWLATAWKEAADGLSWTFTLKQGVTFTDGTPFDAAAVAANVKHVQDPATGSSTGYLALQKVKRVEAVDAHTVRFDLTAPDSALLDSLTQPWVGMESPKALARPQAVNCESPVGTGPFAVHSWKKQDEIVLVRNEDYTSPPADAAHSGAAYLKQIDWRFIPDSAARYAALQSGEVDVIDNAQPNNIVAAGRASGIHRLNAPRPGVADRIELNSGKAPFDDQRVREAFVKAADVDAGISGLFFGTAKRSYSPLSSIETDGYSDPSLFGYDPKAAGALLDAAGWNARDADGYRTKDGTRLTVTFPVSTDQSIPAEQSLFQQIQATEKEVGFQVVLEPVDLNTWYGDLAANAYNAVSAPYTKVGPDVLRIVYDSAGITPAPSGYFANLAQVDLPQVDHDLEQAASTSDAATQKALYTAAQKTILEGYYLLPLYDQQNNFLYGSRVHGLRALPSVSTPELYDVWLQR